MAQQKFTEGQYVRVKTGPYKGKIGRVFEVIKPKRPCGFYGRIIYNVCGVGVYPSYQLELLDEQPITVKIHTKCPVYYKGNLEYEIAFGNPKEVDELIWALEQAKFDHMFGTKNNDNESK